MTARDKQAREYVDEFVHDFCDFNDTSMLCIYNLNSDDDALSFCGDAEDMVRPFVGILLAAYDAEKHDGLSQLIASLFCAFDEVVDTDDKDDEIANFYRGAFQKLLNREFKPKKKNVAPRREEEREETFEELKAKLNKMGYNVSRKPTSKPQPKGTKK